MSTILHLVDAEQLVKLDPLLSWREQEERLIYALPNVINWLRDQLPQEISGWQIERSPIEQLDSFLEDYCSGRELVYGRQFHPFVHASDGVWVLKTPDLRLFGWFPHKDCFICSFGNTAHKVKQSNLYNGYVSQTAYVRDSLDLDEPKFISGEDPDVVISNFSYPP